MTVDTGDTSAAYSLTEGFMDGQIFEIDADRHAKLSEAISTVVSALKIEGVFQVFAESFLRFEKDLLDIPFEYAFANRRELHDEVFFSSIRPRFNLNIISILTSYKSYDDHCNGTLKSSVSFAEAAEVNTEISHKAYDNHLSYRICAGLRNYANIGNSH